MPLPEHFDSASRPEIFSGRYRLCLDQSLPIGRKDGKAFAVSDAQGAIQGRMAILCDPDRPPRLSQWEAFCKLDAGEDLLSPREWSVLKHAGQDYPLLLFDRPQGGRILREGRITLPSHDYDSSVRALIETVSKILMVLEAQSLSHRALWPGNLYFRSGPRGAHWLVGQCLSCPAGTMQPDVFETPGCALAHAEGRGLGDVQNDVYALGVTVLSLLAGHLPFQGVGADIVGARRQEYGSYSALTAGIAIPREYAEFLRGTLQDDPQQRWAPQELAQWLQGQTPSARQTILPTKARMLYEFEGKKHSILPVLASSMAANWQSATHQLGSTGFSNWARRALPDQMRTDIILARQDSDPVARDYANDQWLCRTLHILDRQAPLRFRSVSAMASGFGQYFALRQSEASMQRDFRMVAFSQLQQHRRESSADGSSEARRVSVELGRLANHRELRWFGTLEYFCHMLYPDLPCRAGILRGAYVFGVSNVLPALEAALRSRQSSVSVECFDSWLIGYLLTGIARASMGHWYRVLDLQSSPSALAVGKIELLASYQPPEGEFLCPYICKEAVQQAEPCLRHIRNLASRESMRKHLRELAQAGQLAPLWRTLASKEFYEEDARNYRQACKEYEMATSQLAHIDDMLRAGADTIRLRAAETAALATAGLSVVSLFLAIVFLV